MITYPHRHMKTLRDRCPPYVAQISLRVKPFGDDRYRPVVFVNATHSADLVLDQGEYYGLPECWLRWCASGYIGLLGPHHSRYATAIAEQLFQASVIDNLRPAAALQRIRAQVSQEFADCATSEYSEYQEKFLYTFMYVYYGNPLAQFILHSALDEEQSS